MPDPLLGDDEIKGQNKNTKQRIQPHTGDGSDTGRYRWLYVLIPEGLVMLFIAIYSSIEVVHPQ